MHKVRRSVDDPVACCICVSVCLSVTSMRPAKTVERIYVRFAVKTLVNQTQVINFLQFLTATLFQILQVIAIVLEVAVIYLCCPRKLLLIKN